VKDIEAIEGFLKNIGPAKKEPNSPPKKKEEEVLIEIPLKY
jgi:hypothetical protein